MSDTKTLDPEAKQAEENERLKNVFENDQREGEIEALNKQFTAPSFTPPHEIGDPQQPATGDVPLKDSTPGDSSTPSDSAPTASKTDGGSPAQDDNTRPTGKGKWRDRAKKWNEMRKKGIKNTAKDAAKEAAKKAMKKVAEQAAKRATDAVAPGAGEATVRVTKGLYKGGKTLVQTGNLIQAGQELGQQAMSLLKLAAIIAIIIITVFVIIIIPVIAFFLDEESQELQRQSATQIIPFSITKTGPSGGRVNNGQEITYTIKVEAQQGSGDITVEDPIPQGTTFVRASGKVTCDTGATCSSTSRKVLWKSKDNNLTPPFTTSFTITVMPTVRDSYVVNAATGTSEFGEITGDAKTLARQILAMPDRIILLNRSKEDIQAVIDGRPIQNSSSCGNAVTIHPELLKVMVYLGQRHTYTVWNIVTGHACDRFYHPKGRAMDIGSADGRNSWQNASFRQDAADILPDGGTLLQTYCPGTPPVIPRRRLIQGADGCNHQHIDVGIAIP